jgi:HEAT repeat protein
MKHSVILLALFLLSFCHADEFADFTALQKHFEAQTSITDKLEAIRDLDVEYVSVLINPVHRVKLIGIFMRDTNLAVRVRAAQAVAFNNCAETYAAELQQLLIEDPSPRTIRTVARAMGASRSPSFAGPLEALLQHPDYGVRIDVARQLMHIDHKAAIRFLAPQLRSSELGHHLDAIGALGIGKTPLGQELLEAELGADIAAVRSKAVEALGRYSALGRPAKILPLLHDVDADVRAETCQALAYFDTDAFAPAVAELLQDPVADTRRAAIEALRQMRAVEYLPQIKDMQNDSNDRVRRRAKIALYLMSKEG